jgi:diguanylate cyclase (GGDEF)-like protein
MTMDRRFCEATAPILRAKSQDELQRKIVDALAATSGFDRVAVLSVPDEDLLAHPVYQRGQAPLEAVRIPYQFSAESEELRWDPLSSYVVVPLRGRSGLVSLLYADSLRHDVQREDACAVLTYVANIAAMVSVNVSLMAELADLSRVDPVTGLPNRRFFEERLDDELRRSARSRRSFALAIVDVDMFTNINKRYGEQAGAVLLHDLGHAIRLHARQIDFLARFGADEFSLLVIDADRGAAQVTLERMLKTIREVSSIVQNGVTASVGIALSFPVDTRESIVERADAALYEAKRAGGDCLRFA